MTTNQHIEKWQYYSGILIVLIGMVHVSAIFPIFATGYESLPGESMPVGIYMFIATGVAVMFTGLLIIYCSNGMANLENRAWYSLMFCGGFLIMIGGGAVAVMPGNPFAWVMLAAALVQIFPFILFGKHFQRNCRGMAYINASGILKDELEGADHIDIKQYEGRKDLQQFIAALLSYYPWWLAGLYRIRKVFVRCLGMTQEPVPKNFGINADDISMIPGEMVAFFKVEKAQKDHFWIAAAEDRHLKGLIGVVMERTDAGSNRYHLITIVHYKHWSGPIYFNVIRPFHHLVVHAMALHGIRS
ncbi:MAG: DUF2867 domain-containing protein [Desulfobacula sp.]|nr:DUF2867 domain-containing protein [Desulfobacula sp.]